MLNKHETSFEEPIAGNPHGGFCQELAPSRKKEQLTTIFTCKIKKKKMTSDKSY